MLLATIKALKSREAVLLYVGSQGRGVLEEAGIRTHRYWYRRTRYRSVTFLTYFLSQVSLFRALSKSRCIPSDATIFVNTLLPVGAMIWGKWTGRRVVVHVHEASITPGLFRRFLTYCATRCADLLLYVSNDHLARLPIPGPPARVVPNPVNPALAARAFGHVRRREGGVFRVLMLASLRGYKGVEEYMGLASAMLGRPDIVFDLVLNADAVEVTTFIAEHPFAHNVAIHHRTDDPAKFYSCADLVLNLSRMDQWIETFGLTLVEAMTFGIPVIVPPIGGPAEIVVHGIEGYCIDSRDADALRSALLRIADDPEIYAGMSIASKARARDFTFEAYASALNDALDVRT